MTTTPTSQGTTAQTGDDIEIYDDPDRGVGWLFFAGTILGLAGIMRIIDSIWAFRYKGALPEGFKDGVLGDNLKSYAWVFLIVGIILVISSFLVIVRSQFARWIGIVAAALAAISAVGWLPFYPVWSLVYIGLAVMVLYALGAHGGRVRV